MTISLIIVLISGLLLLFIYLILRTEDIKQRRLLFVDARSKADFYLESRLNKLHELSQHLHNFNIKLLGHFLLHQFLSLVLYFVRMTESIIHKLRIRNKVAAYSIKGVLKDDSTKNHLDHIAEHRESTSLSDQDKKRIKDEAIGL